MMKSNINTHDQRIVFAFTVLSTFFIITKWGIAYTGGSGIADDPYQIADVNDLQQLADTSGDYDNYFILTADIDLTGKTWTAAVIAPDTNNSTSGFQGTDFTGVFNGNGHTISNLIITAADGDYVGLFGHIGAGGQIKNLGLENSTIEGRANVGGLCGWSFGSFESCYTSATVTGSNYIGGLCGYQFYGTINRCYATGAVTGSGNYIGGLCGYKYSCTVEFCYATGNVTGSSSNSLYVGGLCGQAVSSGGTISQCYATGAVSGKYYIGGLCGYNLTDTISQCYATGAITESSKYAGGLCGYNHSGTISHCYSTGAITGSSYVGGFCGYNYSAGTLSSCFWDTETSNKSSGVGTNSGSSDVTGVLTLAMKTLSTFTDDGWDFTNETANGTYNYWRMCTNGVSYPQLNWQSSTGDLACSDGVDLNDFNDIAVWWLTACESSNNYCGQTDINLSGTVDVQDIVLFAILWLDGTSTDE